MGKRVIDKRYEVLKRLGAGGMGEVYKVKDRTSGATLALKLTRKGISEDELILFKKEFYTLASLRHPNIVKVHDFGSLPNGRHYITMDFIPGEPITKAFRGFHKSLLLTLVQILSALDYIHSKGLIHGDLKPDNIIITRDKGRRPKDNEPAHLKPSVTILDFGFAEDIGPLDSSVIRGTLGYIAPEQLKGGKADGRSDLYSLGVLLYETLTQRRAFRGRTPSEVLRANLEKTPPPPRELDPGIPPGLEELAMRLVQKDPRDRYESTSEVLEVVSRLTETPVPTRARARVPELSYSPIVGRKEDLSALEAALSRIRNSTGQLVLISGETGVGKSRILQEFKARAQISGCRVISIPCCIGDLVGQFCKQLGVVSPEFETTPQELHKLRVFDRLSDSIIRWVEGLKTPAVFLLDDFGSADETGQEFLGLLCRSLRSHPAMVVATFEPNGASGRFREAVEDEPFLAELPLSGLSSEETGALVSNLLNTKEELNTLAQWTYARTNGNPLLIEETLRSILTQQILKRRGKTWVLRREALRKLRPSRTLAAFARSWIKRLSKEETDILSAAAVLGGSFPLSRLADLSGRDEADFLPLVSSLQRKGLLRSDSDGYYRFCHRSVQDHLYRRMDKKKRRQLHKYAAEALEILPPERSDELLPSLAYHYRQAEVRVKAFQFAAKAAAKEELSHARESALDHYRAALRLAPSERRLGILQRIGDLSSDLGFDLEALRSYRSARQLKALSSQQQAELWLKTACIYRKRKEYPKALDAVQEGLSALKRQYCPPRADLLTEWAWIWMEKGEYDKAIECCGEAEAIAIEVRDKRGLANVYNALGILHWRKGRLDDAIEFTMRTLGLREELRDTLGEARSYNNLGVIYWTKGDLDEADKCYQNSLAGFQALGDIRSVADTHLNMGLLSWTRGDWQDSERATCRRTS